MLETIVLLHIFFCDLLYIFLKEFIYKEMLCYNIQCYSKVWGQYIFSFFNEINTFIQDGCVKLIKRLKLLEKISILNKCCFFYFVFIKE